jgi:hypothetical protein
MIPWAAQYLAPFLRDYNMATAMMTALPDPASDPPSIWTCHGMSRLFVLIDPTWSYHDGHFITRGTEHAWCAKDNAILDVYPVGGIAPILWDGNGHAGSLYKRDPAYYSIVKRDRWDKEARHALSLLERWLKTFRK